MEGRPYDPGPGTRLLLRSSAASSLKRSLAEILPPPMAASPTEGSLYEPGPGVELECFTARRYSLTLRDCVDVDENVAGRVAWQ